MKIGIIGCGWLGIRLAKYLSKKHDIYTTTTLESKKEKLIESGFKSLVIKFFDDKILEKSEIVEKFLELDIIIITVPFSKSTKIHLLQNRFDNLSLFIDKFKNQIFLMSSIGIYPQTEREITEDNILEEDLNPSILFVEKLMRSNYPQINILRLGGLMGDNRIFSNYEITAPEQVVNHIHYQDICYIVEKMIEKGITTKTYNIVAPMHPTKQEIIDYQKGSKNEQVEAKSKPFGRIILSKKSEIELDFIYKHPNPVTFT
jgi:nucleoside-diphosphate-sugar epimerase